MSADLHCRPLRGPEHRIASDTAATRLASLPGWALVEDGVAILRTFRFSDYYRTLAFVNAIAFIAHREDHHPDLSVHYDRCVVRYSTHDVGGLSDNDFICAAKVSRLADDAAA
ncbi:4a-hydroxytetrahydrobiopterin dehydratase [Xanthomonadaceae bacterium JHOS43]|nr:4a-hydroxytetrahydrobiopterin dehydratase [Xanthomonadaceae bacterium JHOS43]MCX7562930.1 4a-hydroxytetrahydrobiopterin dehydratase [Xanthomonadaceae bacterium XH05]